MPKYLKPFIMGVLCTLLVVYVSGYFMDRNRPGEPSMPEAGIQHKSSSTAAAPATDTVKIQSLPSLRILSGIKVAFNGKTEFPQVIAGRYAKNLSVSHFSATGENAHKSTIRIVWADGTADVVPAGTYDRVFPPEKRAKQITVTGYSMYERRIFKDSAKPGTLTWEIKYLPVAE